jgi:hypothetical protein
MRRFSKLLAAVVLPMLVVLGGCKDYSNEIATVQNTVLRHVAGNGETQTWQLGLPLAEYVKKEFGEFHPQISWSADAPVPEGEATPPVRVDATLRPREAFLVREIALHFSYEPASQRVTYLGADINGSPARTASGNPAKLAHVYDAIIDRVQARAQGMVDALGGSEEFEAEMQEIDDLQDQRE